MTEQEDDIEAADIDSGINIVKERFDFSSPKSRNVEINLHLHRSISKQLESPSKLRSLRQSHFDQTKPVQLVRLRNSKLVFILWYFVGGIRRITKTSFLNAIFRPFVNFWMICLMFKTTMTDNNFYVLPDNVIYLEKVQWRVISW